MGTDREEKLSDCEWRGRESIVWTRRTVWQGGTKKRDDTLGKSGLIDQIKRQAKKRDHYIPRHRGEAS
eukprot:1338470-Amorphochlora_amoeboformis.AAC.1